MLWLLGEYKVPAVFGGFDSVARFNIISVVSPVSSRAASSQTHFKKLTAHTHKPQGKRKRKNERERQREGGKGQH